MRTTRLLAVVAVAALSLSAAACSSDSDGADAPTKAEFIKAGDAICKKGDAEIDKLGKGVDIEDVDAAQAFFVKAAEASLGQIAAVRALGFPEGDEDRLDKDLKVSEAAFEKVKADPSKTEELSADKDIEKAQKDLASYGFEECGS